MMLVPVFIVSWQVESGLDRPPAVGETVDFRLYFEEAITLGPDDKDGIISLTASAQRLADDEGFGAFPTRLDRPGLAVFWDADREVLGPVTLTGRISADWHHMVPQDFPSTNGVVRSIAVEHRQYVVGDPRGIDGPMWVRAPGQPWYIPVDQMPKWFPYPDLPVGPCTVQTGVRVGLELTGRPPH